MNIEISLYYIVSYACDVLFETDRVFRARVAHGYKKGDTYWGLCPGYKSYKDLNEAIASHEKSLDKLYTICDVTGINFTAIMTMARYYNRYGEACGWEKTLKERQLTRLYQCLTAKTPEDLSGIYRSEYFEAANDRLNVSRWGRW